MPVTLKGHQRDTKNVINIYTFQAPFYKQDVSRYVWQNDNKNLLTII